MGYTDTAAVTEATLVDLLLLADADYLVAGPPRTLGRFRVCPSLSESVRVAARARRYGGRRPVLACLFLSESIRVYPSLSESVRVASSVQGCCRVTSR